MGKLTVKKMELISRYANLHGKMIKDISAISDDLLRMDNLICRIIEEETDEEISIGTYLNC